jgi:hypothetical protein
LFSPAGFLRLTVNVFIEILDSHFPKAPNPFDPALNCQSSDCKPDILLVPDHLIQIFACYLPTPAPYNCVHCIYEATRAITLQFKLLNRRHGSYLGFYYKTGKTDISILGLLVRLWIANIMAIK